MYLRKGISPILATVIIIAVTLVIAIGVIGWIMGIWGGFGTTESLQIYPDSNLTTSGTIVIHVKNTGSATATINKIEVVGGNSSTGLSVTSGDCTENDGKVSISAGEECYVKATDLGSGYTAGATYQVKIYTDAGNVYSTVIRAE